MLSDKNPEYWFEISKHDTETVELLIREKGYPDIIVYHCHQAVEKILKGLILDEKQSFPFIHDIVRLNQILIEKNNFYENILNEVIMLHSFYNELRYPQSKNISAKDLLIAYNNFKIILGKLKINNGGR